MSVMAVLSVKMLTANMLLSVLFVSGALADCTPPVHLFITAPERMEALSGSCLQIPCNFSAKNEQEFDSSREITGVWMKDNVNFGQNPANLIFNSGKTNNIYPMNITGNLSQKNCTTLFSDLITNYTNTYYFRIENSPYKATASCDPVYLTVKDSPPSPTIEISGDLKEKESVTLTCSALTPCPHSPPQLTWNLQQDSQNKIEENPDRTFTTKIQRTITLSDQHDGYDISCSARYPVNEGKDVKTAEKRKTLNVSYAPKNTKVSISSSGSLVNLTCSSRANPPISHFTWFKNSKDGSIKVFEGQVYSLNATDEGVYYCVATNDVGNQTSCEFAFSIAGSQNSVNVLLWGSLLGGIIVFILCLALFIWWFKSKHQTPQKTQSEGGDEQAFQMPVSKTEEDIYYGEINFSKLRSEWPTVSVQHSEEKQDTVYAQVKVSETTNNLNPTADSPEDLYSQVKTDLSKLRPEEPSDAVQESGEQQDTLYAQVNMSESANGLSQTADNSQDLYAQVTKK